MFQNKVILQLLLLTTVASVISLSYYVLYSYRSYQVEEASHTTTHFVEEITKALERIASERGASIAYLHTQTNHDFLILKQSREEVDFILNSIDRFIKQEQSYTLYNDKLEALITTLKSIRQSVDRAKIDFEEIFFEGYHANVSSPLLEILYSISIIQPSHVLQTYLHLYHSYALLKENTHLENSYITSILLGSKKLSYEGIAMWHSLMRYDTLPILTPIADTPEASQIEALLSKEGFALLLSREREVIEHEALTADYSISVEGWAEQIEQKLSYINRVEQLLHDKIATIEEGFLLWSKVKLALLALGVIALFVLMLKLFGLYIRTNKKQTISKKTLDAIEQVFDKSQQEELHRLILEGRVEHIYKFLIQAMQDANQTKDLFLASMSHEIRTPLNGILGFTKLLQEAESKEERDGFIAVIEKSGVNLLNIVNDILDLSKIKAQKVELENIDFDPIDNFEVAVESYAAKAAEEEIDFCIFLDPQLPTHIMGDPTKISQVVVNLVSNAIKFTPAKGRVSVLIEKLSEDNKSVEMKFSVTDTGIGISDEQKANLFQSFSQADVSTSRKYGGTGLGLSISGRLIELMGGKIQIRSVEGEGSTFYFTLTFEKSKNSRQREGIDKSGYTIGVLGAKQDRVYEKNSNLEAYVRYTGANFIRYTEESILQLQGSKSLPDVLFIDYKFRARKGEIDKFLALDTKVVLLATTLQKSSIKPHISSIERVVYKPLNFTKTIKALSKKENSEILEQEIIFSNTHILIAEDNAINQKLITHLLDKFDINVTIAHNGQEALDLYIAGSYDMIFMDIEMPIMGGMEATGKIINYERSNAIAHKPIVALTANTLSGDKEIYMSAGMDAYLSKPIELPRLKEVLMGYFEDRVEYL